MEWNGMEWTLTKQESFHNLKSVIDKSSDEEVTVAGQTSDFILSKKLSVRKDLDNVNSQIDKMWV